ncbi:hypothetical protein HGA64_01795, partial [Candidatus Falkowbacteria bacterium]|nr:hypothetical protein [Candidatus Falkowbacteria bacterium]
MSIRTRKQNPQKYENNRINLLMAVIFVIGAATIVKLYDLQVRKYDHYMDMAKRQQQSMSKVEPQRGRIFIQDNQEWSSDNELFPLATNKDFATLYARPNAIKNPQAVAEGLFSVIDQPFIEKDVENDLAFSEYATSSSETLKAAAKELEVRKRKDALIAEYVSMLSRPNDPYEVIEPKIELDDAQRIKAMGLEGVDYSPIQGRYYP